MIREVNEKQNRTEWNKLVQHPMQTWEWGEFRQLTGVEVARYGIYQDDKLIEPITITIHKIPLINRRIGYFPKGKEITDEQIEVLKIVAKKYRCIYIKCEPKTEMVQKKIEWLKQRGFVAGRTLFTPYNFVLEVTPSEEELLKQMKQKTRYNIRLAEKKGVKVEIDNSDEAFEKYLELSRETTKRQGFYAHTTEYHRKMWKELRDAGMAELLVAKHEGKIVTTWVLFTHNDTLYYPYGASTREHRELMANNLVMWEAIKIAKARGLKYLDMWGALGDDPKGDDPWYGFHKFKEGYGGRHVKYLGTWDYVADPLLYYPLRVGEGVRWKMLRMRK